MKHIMALPTHGQTCSAFVLHPFEMAKFQTKPPVHVTLRTLSAICLQIKT